MNLFALAKLTEESGITYRILRTMRRKGQFQAASPADVVALVLLGFTPEAAREIAAGDGKPVRTTKQIGDSATYGVTVERISE